MWERSDANILKYVNTTLKSDMEQDKVIFEVC